MNLCIARIHREKHATCEIDKSENRNSLGRWTSIISLPTRNQMVIYTKLKLLLILKALRPQ